MIDVSTCEEELSQIPCVGCEYKKDHLTGICLACALKTAYSKCPAEEWPKYKAKVKECSE